MRLRLKIRCWLAMFGVLLAGCSTPSPTAVIRLNQIQVIGTHNSYHQRTDDSLMKLIARSNPQAARDLDYTHRPLREQLSRLGIRQLELDCYADPDGGRFARPLGPIKAAEAGLAVPPSNDPEGKLLKPGIKVLHIPDIDFGTSVLTLVDGLREVRSWSLEHPRHIPIFILIELKDETLGAGFTRTLPWGQAELAELEREILSVFPREAILMPDDIRGAARTLPEALRQHGWPLLDRVRGKVLFGLDNEGREQAEYLMGHPALEGRILFVSVPPTNPAAAWIERNDPIKDFLEIQNLVKAGFLVRTRADEPTEQARANDTNMRDHALTSGAQYISTDYPEPDPNFSPYRVQIEGGQVARINPVNGPPNFLDKNIK
jgi:Phosphoinositide phospholipase C, Ca2+-dependent